MLKHTIIGIVFFLFGIGTHPLFAQVKYEKESRLKEKDVPSIALDFIDSLAIKKKVKWYLEVGFNRTSIESKFKMNNHKYSIEFDTLGNLEDIELQIKWDELNKTLQDSIDFHLREDCKKFIVRRIQIQYSGDRSVLLPKIKTGESAEDYMIKYELVVKCCYENNINLFEYLFSNSGQKLKVSQIVFKNSSHLEY
ncbi:MAG TPA: hypothetical protein PKA00_08175 [Saprospiraceae bacterium]|nr:hypothetical protein [Saprospiraceae bacterium]HMQ82870.1 hypothetical protein [Saprospiraceae bacterium]